MKNMTRILALLLILCMVFSLIACNVGGETPPEGEKPVENPEEEKPQSSVEDPETPVTPETPVVSTRIELFAANKAQFRVVLTAEAGEKTRAMANTFVTRLRALGADIEDPIEDSDAEAVTDCEILIGGGAKNRGEECAVDTSLLSENSYYIRIIGDRILIYGGSDEKIAEAIDFFSAACLYVDGESTEIGRTYIKRNFEKTYEAVRDILVNGVSLKNFSLIAGSDGEDLAQAVSMLHRAFVRYAGMDLSIAENGEEPEHPFIVRMTENAGDTGFCVRADGNALVLECAYANTFLRSVTDFITDTVAAFSGVVEIDDETRMTADAYKIYYSEYGAVGDGRTDDFLALMAAHETANATGQTVCADADKTYYIGEHAATIPIRTDTVWGEARFIIDDRYVRCSSSGHIDQKYAEEPDANYRDYNVFKVEADYPSIYMTAEELQGKTLAAGDTNLGMTFPADMLVYITYSGHKIYIRYGANQNEGNDTQEILLVHADGSIDESTAVLWDYPEITSITARRIDEKPITVSGGIFTTYANNHECLYHYYSRGIQVARSNTTVIGVSHYILYEYEQGAPYGSFIGAVNANNILIKDCVFTGHKTYPLKTNPDNNKMGTYDTQGTRSNNVTWDHCTQTNQIFDTTFWGIHASNFCKNLTLKNSTISRFDAHQGMYNATVLNSTLGQYLNCIGAGLLYVDGLTRYAGNEFISLRSDYGSTWKGDVILKNCTLAGYNRVKGTTTELGSDTLYVFSMSWNDWDFGYECYMPQNVTIENFRWDAARGLEIFHLNKDLTNTAQINHYHPVQTVTLRNMSSGNYSISYSTNAFSGTVVIR